MIIRLISIIAVALLYSASAVATPMSMSPAPTGLIYFPTEHQDGFSLFVGIWNKDNQNMVNAETSLRFRMTPKCLSSEPSARGGIKLGNVQKLAFPPDAANEWQQEHKHDKEVLWFRADFKMAPKDTVYEFEIYLDNNGHRTTQPYDSETLGLVWWKNGRTHFADRYSNDAPQVTECHDQNDLADLKDLFGRTDDFGMFALQTGTWENTYLYDKVMRDQYSGCVTRFYYGDGAGFDDAIVPGARPIVADGKIGFIDPKGRTLIPPNIDRMIALGAPRFGKATWYLLLRGDKVTKWNSSTGIESGITDRQGREYEAFWVSTLWTDPDGEEYYDDSLNDRLCYDLRAKFRPHVPILVKTLDGKFGVLNDNGELIVSGLDDVIHHGCHVLFYCEKGISGKCRYGIYNLRTMTKHPAVYDHMQYAACHTCRCEQGEVKAKATKGGLMGVVDSNDEWQNADAAFDDRPRSAPYVILNPRPKTRAADAFDKAIRDSGGVVVESNDPKALVDAIFAGGLTKRDADRMGAKTSEIKPDRQRRIFKVKKGERIKTHRLVSLKRGRVKISLRSDEFDPTCWVNSLDGSKVLASFESDVGVLGEVKLMLDKGEYRLQVMPRSPDQSGEYTITVSYE